MPNNRLTKLKYTTVSSIVSQVVMIICGFILPRLIIGTYGSGQNGLIHSISQFLSVITFLDFGVGTVVQSSLYKPLADHNIEQISKVVISAQRFFRRLAQILIVYLILLVIFYPFVINNDYGFWYTAAMIIVLGYGLFAQYYFGVVNNLLVLSDQKGYLTYNIQIITVILNTVVSCIMIYYGASLLFLKFITSFVFLIRPLFLYHYVNSRYSINYKIQLVVEPIKQKWNGIAMHISSVILDSTDLIVLTIFSSLSNVSVYSVYSLVVLGIKSMFLSATTGIRSLLGNLLATGENDKLEELFSLFEWVIHTSTTLIFGVTGILILPFISVYMYGVTDADYIQPLFAVLIVLAHGTHCLRLPYNNMILAGGHFKQTQSNYVIASVLNISLSIITVMLWGLIGVAIGTLFAMLYQTIWMAVYNSKNIIGWPITKFFKQIAIDIVSILFMILISYSFSMQNISYFSWIIYAIKIGFVSFIVCVVINYIFYKDKIKQIQTILANKRF